jgi:hypothetical protein
MSSDSVHEMIGRAVIDRGFRKHLLRSPADASFEFSLSSWERSLIRTLQASTLEEFAQKLSEKLSENN